jgi:hypothetical protein
VALGADALAGTDDVRLAVELWAAAEAGIRPIYTENNRAFGEQEPRRRFAGNQVPIARRTERLMGAIADVTAAFAPAREDDRCR